MAGEALAVVIKEKFYPALITPTPPQHKEGYNTASPVRLTISSGITAAQERQGMNIQTRSSEMNNKHQLIIMTCSTCREQ